MKLAIAALAFISVAANATNYTFDCKATEKNKTVSIKFLVKNLYSKATLETYPGEDDYEPVKVRPKSSLLNDINENGGFSVNKDRLLLHGDADGFYMLEIVLYRNSGFTKGYARVKGDENLYSKVSCTVAGE